MPPKKSSESFGDLSESERRIVDAISFRIDSVKDEFLAQITVRDRQIEKLTDEVYMLKTNMFRLEEKIDINEAHDRRDTLLFSGSSLPPVSDGENTSLVLITLVQEKLNVVVPNDSILVSHRVGPKPTSGADRRTIIAKLSHHDLKEDLLKAARTVKPDRLYINESLTPLRRTIHYVLRKARKKFPAKISGVITADGKVIVYVKPARPNLRNTRDTKFSLNTREKLEKFCNEILSTPLATLFDGEWPN